ncbi:MAG: ADP-heptose:LPS heptosyltransferase [Bacteroidia bacterium]|jgi:ADP-heptose:LPS heptosyltransferase
MKILIIRFSSIGDIVLTTPVLRCMAQQLPGVELHFITKANYASLLNHNPYVSHVHLYRGNIKDNVKQLQKLNFDLIIDLHNNLRSRILSFQLSSKVYRFNKINWHKFKAVRFKMKSLPDVHIVDRYLKTVEPLGVANDDQGLDYFMDAGTHLPPKLKEVSHDTWVYAIGGQHATKKLPSKKIIELLAQIPNQVVLIGGKEDADTGKQIAKKAVNAINFCGKLSIDQSALLILKTKQLITHDTGMMHIGAALGAKIVSIWGNTIPEFGMQPYQPHSSKGRAKMFEVSGLSCRPCSKIGFDECPKEHFDCMNKQDLTRIVEAINEV